MIQNLHPTMTVESSDRKFSRNQPRPAETKPLPPAIAAENLSASYGGPPVLHRFNLTLPQGELVALIGPNGAGKSTFFKLLSGVMRPTEGSISVFGKQVRDQRRRSTVAYVPQEEQIDWDFPISVWDVVLAGRFGRIREEGFPRRLAPPWFSSSLHHDAAHEALSAVEMLKLASRPIAALSGGQKKRVFLARALAQEARMLLLDEPLAGVDGRSAELIFNVFSRARKEGRTLILVTHDLASAEKYADRIVLINRTVMAEGAPEKVLTLENLAKAFEGGFIPARYEQ